MMRLIAALAFLASAFADCPPGQRLATIYLYEAYVTEDYGCSDLLGSADPYIKVSMTGETTQTVSAKDGTTRPVWYSPVAPPLPRPAPHHHT